MKAVFISYNQSLTEKLRDLLNELSIRGYTQWNGLTGRGSVSGDYHEGTHTWPELNNAYLTVVADEIVPVLLERLKKLDHEKEDEGIRAFVWNVEKTV